MSKSSPSGSFISFHHSSNGSIPYNCITSTRATNANIVTYVYPWPLWPQYLVPVCLQLCVYFVYILGGDGYIVNPAKWVKEFYFLANHLLQFVLRHKTTIILQTKNHLFRVVSGFNGVWNIATPRARTEVPAGHNSANIAVLAREVPTVMGRCGTHDPNSRSFVPYV